MMKSRCVNTLGLRLLSERICLGGAGEGSRNPLGRPWPIRSCRAFMQDQGLRSVVPIQLDVAGQVILPKVPQLWLFPQWDLPQPPKATVSGEGG